MFSYLAWMVVGVIEYCCAFSTSAHPSREVWRLAGLLQTGGIDPVLRVHVMDTVASC